MGNQALGDSESTWALGVHSEGTRSTFGHLKQSVTPALRALGHSGT